MPRKVLEARRLAPNPNALKPQKGPKPLQGLPVTEKTYLSKELHIYIYMYVCIYIYIETIIRNPRKVGLSGYR